MDTNQWLTAADSGDLDLARQLLAEGVPVPFPALARAVHRDDSALVEVMLYAGADPDGP